MLERSLAIVKLYASKDYKNYSKIINLHCKIWKVCDLLSETCDYGKEKHIKKQTVLYMEKHLKLGDTNVEETLDCLRVAARDLPGEQTQVLERNLPIFERHYGSNNIRFADVLIDLSKLYGQDDLIRRKQIQEQALSIYESHYGTDHIIVADALALLAETYRDLCNYHKQKERLERALPIFEEQLDSVNPVTADRLLYLAEIYGALRDYHKHIALLERYLIGVETEYGAYGVISNIKKCLANAYEVSRKHVKEKHFLERLLSDKHDRDVAGIKQRLSIVYTALGYPLHGAVVAGELKKENNLVLVSDNVNTKMTDDGLTPLHLAAREGYEDIASLLMRKAQISKTTMVQRHCIGLFKKITKILHFFYSQKMQNLIFETTMVKRHSILLHEKAIWNFYV